MHPPSLFSSKLVLIHPQHLTTQSAVSLARAVASGVELRFLIRRCGILPARSIAHPRPHD